MLGMIFSVIVLLLFLTQLYSTITIIREKKICQQLLSLDIFEIVLSIIIALVEHPMKPIFIDYALCAFIIFVFLRNVISFIFLNLAILKAYKGFAIALLFVVAIFAGFIIYFINKQINSSYTFSIITSSEFEELKETSSLDNIVVFVGRPNCNACTQALPEIQRIVHEKKLIAYYYDTKVAREQDENQMNSLLDEFEIFVVPSIVILYTDGTSKTITGNNVTEEFANLSQQL